MHPAFQQHSIDKVYQNTTWSLIFLHEVSHQSLDSYWSFGPVPVMNNLLLDQTNFYWKCHVSNRPCEWHDYSTQTCYIQQPISPDTPVSSTNKTDCHDITEILLKLVLNTINLNQTYKSSVFETSMLTIIGHRLLNITSLCTIIMSWTSCICKKLWKICQFKYPNNPDYRHTFFFFRSKLKHLCKYEEKKYVLFQKYSWTVF
jgi:hypothetical protein